MLLRLAERNGIKTYAQLSALTELTIRDLRNGIGVNRLAAILHCDPDRLLDCTPLVSSASFAIRGERFSAKQAVKQSVRRLCPDCVRQSAHHRFWFDLEFVTTCPAHGRPLIRTCSCGQPLSWADVRISKCRRCDNGDVTTVPWTPANPDIIEMDRWILGRLGVGKAAPASFLDGLDLGAALHLMQNVGVLDLGGYQTAWPEPADFGVSMAEARSRGFKVLKHDRLSEIMDRVCAEFVTSKSGRAATIKNAYGWFGQWLLDLQPQDVADRICEMAPNNAPGQTRWPLSGRMADFRQAS
ncbi:TniQ family protein [Rhodopseudomonas palustris]|uniref:TniQ family protein n=1 Tax=Rhodopseudomonas palustris TaxID=1076 RepID=UPI001F33A05B|nr:TniQ family protein [Rhodopseudomonas palustris]